MSKRKYIRKMLKAQAESIGAKASRYVKREWDRYQIKRYGFNTRRVNQCKSTHVYKVWGQRILLASDM